MNNITQFEIREFRAKSITGAELLDIVRENGLENYRLVSFTTEHNVPSNGFVSPFPYTDVVKFRKVVS